MEADWVAAWGQVAGAAGTFGTLVIALRVLRLEQRDRLRQDVRAVRVWVEYSGQPQKLVSDDSSFEMDFPPTSDPVLVVENGTDEVIYNVTLGAASRYNLRELPALTGLMMTTGPHPYLRPGEQLRDPIVFVGESDGDRPWPPNRQHYLATVKFTDGRGADWVREPSGRLRMFKPGPKRIRNMLLRRSGGPRLPRRDQDARR